MMRYSQYGEEHFLLKIFSQKNDGFLVDIGAADGITNSNSRFLIEKGWGGLLIEPNKNNFQKLVNLYSSNKKIFLENCGCFNQTLPNSVFYIDKNDEYEQISTFCVNHYNKCKEIYNCEFKIDNINLIKTSEVLIKFNIRHIDFMSIDAEGFDDQIIEGIDFNKVNITLLCIENISVNTVTLLKKLGYDNIYNTLGNKFFKKNNEKN